MKVEFHRTGEKRYAFVAHRDGLPPFRMDPAAGFDALMPHDMLHFIVEKKLKIRRGVFGQIAEGGSAAAFLPGEASATNKKENARIRRDIKRKSRKLANEGQDDCAQSERATYICWHDWLAHSSNAAHRNRAAEMKDTAQSILGGMPAHEKKALNEEFLAKMRLQLEKLSTEWSALEIGQFMTAEWTLQK
jgi:hypothetical protein